MVVVPENVRSSSQETRVDLPAIVQTGLPSFPDHVNLSTLLWNPVGSWDLAEIKASDVVEGESVEGAFRGLVERNLVFVGNLLYAGLSACRAGIL